MRLTIVAARRLGAGLLTLVVVAGIVVACGARAVGRVSMPPDSAEPLVVLQAWLAAVTAGDCETAHALALPSFKISNGELCGVLKITAIGIIHGPGVLSANHAAYAAELTTSGSDDGSILPGSLLWFVSIDRQPDGRWRLAGGGTGP
jgi:hypothetical protein